MNKKEIIISKRPCSSDEYKEKLPSERTLMFLSLQLAKTGTKVCCMQQLNK